ncbi:MAG TPA: response regulator, partial [Rudaea sp.]
SAQAREWLQETLRAFHFQTVTAASGEAAIHALHAEPFDLVLIDWKMPGLDGIETTRRIKTDPRLSQIPEIIMISAFDRDAIQKSAEAAGAKHFLVKPVTPSLLLETIVQTLGTEKVAAHASTPQTQAQTKTSIRGARVLLAEDNPVNQELAKEILSQAGATVDVVGTGAAAVSSIDRVEYDAVLMDVQMPEMDGYEATARIRKQARHRNLPIIALTAHATAGYREECLAAGMNDYITKPLVPEELFGALAAWIRKGDCAPGGRSEAMPTEDFFDSDLPGIDVDELRRRVNGNEALARKLLSMFGQQNERLSDDISAALERNDTAAAERMAHSAAGSAGNLSATRLHRAAHTLEQAIGRRDWSQISAAFDPFVKALDQILATVHAIPASAMPTTAPLQRDVATLIDELVEQLENGYPQAQKTIEQLRAALGADADRADFAAIERFATRFEFEAALKAVHAWLRSESTPPRQ